MAAVDSPISGMMDSSSQVSDSLVPNVYMTPVCKLGDSDTDFSDMASLVSHFSMPCVMIGVQACSDWLLTGYDYSTKVCHVLLVMDF